MKLENYLDAMPEMVKIDLTREAGEVYVELDGEPLDPELSLKIRNHSPSGFNWGYSGSGPAQLSLAILLKYLPVHLASQHYQWFKGIVASWKTDRVIAEIPLREILKALV